MRFNDKQKKIICAVIAVAMIIPVVLGAIGIIASI